MTASPQALAAVRAVKHQREWGAFATGRFLERHNAVHHFVVATRFEAMRQAKRVKS